MQPFPTIRSLMSLLAWRAFTVFQPFFTYAQNPSPTVTTQPSTKQTAIWEDYNFALQPWKGNYDEMVKRRMVRIAVPYSMTHYFLDGAVERGISAAMGRQLERQINQREKLRTRLVDVVFIPAPRNQLIPHLTAGLADIAMGNITITESRSQMVDFFYRSSEIRESLW